jgi:hypothetical protein
LLTRCDRELRLGYLAAADVRDRLRWASVQDERMGILEFLGLAATVVPLACTGCYACVPPRTLTESRLPGDSDRDGR